MPIKSLESYLFERKLVNTSSIEVLQNATIGIDVDHYLGRIYTFKKEQFLAGTGGIPSSLKDYIHSDLQVFKEFNIKPIFVIPGIDIELQTTRYRTNELSSREQHLENTWLKLNNKHPYSSIESFRLFTDPLPLKPMINDLVKYFIEIEIDYIIAPYDSSFQLSYLYQSKFIDSIYGSTDLLLTQVDKFILGMEFQSKDFRFIDKYKILSELNLTERKFMDLSIIVGCNIQPKTFSIFPPLPKPNPVQPYPQLSYFKLGLDIAYQYNAFNNSPDLRGYIVNLNNPKLLDLYLRGISAINFVPVLNKDGYVELYSVEMAKLGIYDNVNLLNNDEKESNLKTESTGNKVVKVPNDIHDIISQRLPPEIYFYQSIGLVPNRLLEAITHGQLDIRPTLESGLSDSFKKLITSSFYRELLDDQFNLITQLLARYYQVKKVNIKYWFNDEVLALNNRLVPPIFQRIDSIFINATDAKFSLVNFFKTFSSENVSSRQISGNNNAIISTVTLRAFYLFGLFNRDTKHLTSVSIILKRFVEANEDVTEEEFEELFLILLLIMSKSLKLTEPNREFSGTPKYFKDFNGEELTANEIRNITLISRVFSLHRFHISPINYQGPISRVLLNFRSHVKFIADQFITTIQSLAVDFCVRQKEYDIRKLYSEKKKWYELIDQLPFYKDVNNTLLGVVAEIYFEYSAKQSRAVNSKEDIVRGTKEHLLNYVFQINNPSFNINVNGVNSITGERLLSDFDNGIRFWKKFIKLIEISNSIDKDLLSDEYYKEIKDSDDWLKGFI